MYKRPSYDIKTTGVFTFKTKDKEYLLKSYHFERENDTEDSLQIQDELRGEIGGIRIKNSAWNKLAKGETIIAKTSKAKGDITGRLTRIDDINNSDKYAEGGGIDGVKVGGYEVDFFHTVSSVYANIEIPSENPLFEDDIQIKGVGKTEQEALEDLKKNYKNKKYAEGGGVGKMATGGEIKSIKKGDRIKDKYGYEAEVYYADGDKIEAQYKSGATYTYRQKDFDNGYVRFLWSDRKLFATGGGIYDDGKKYEKGGDMNEYSKGGNVIERRYVNKEEDYETRYAKDKPMRTGYKNERKFAVGGEVGNTVSFKGDYGTPRSGVVKEKRGSSYIVATDDGDRLVDSYEVIGFSETPIAKKKRFGFFEGGGSIESKKQTILNFVNSFSDKPKNWSEATDELPDLHHDIADEYNGKYDFDFNKRSSLNERNLRHKKGIKSLLNKLSDENISNVYSKWEETLEDKYAGGGEIEGKIEDLQAVVDGDFPQFAKDKAKAEIEKLEKELHESKETKAEEKEEHKAGGSEAKKPTTRKAPVKKAADKSKVVGDDLKVIKFFDLTESDWNKMALNERNKLSDSYKEKNKPAKADHKKLLAKIKAKKGAAPSNEPSKGHKRSESSDRKREALPLGKRVSADGNTYYENRLNRADMNKEDKFEEGGEILGKVYESEVDNLPIAIEYRQREIKKSYPEQATYIEYKNDSKGKYAVVRAKGNPFKGKTQFEEGGEVKSSGWGLKFLNW